MPVKNVKNVPVILTEPLFLAHPVDLYGCTSYERASHLQQIMISFLTKILSTHVGKFGNALP